MILVQQSSPLSGAGLDHVCDLTLVQREPIGSRGRDSRFNTAVVDGSSVFPEDYRADKIIRDYSARNGEIRLNRIFS